VRNRSEPGQEHEQGWWRLRHLRLLPPRCGAGRERGPRRHVLSGGDLGLGGDDDSGGEGRGGESGAEGGLSGSGHSSRLSDKGGAEDPSEEEGATGRGKARVT
jgi:hypothetical protein